MEFLLKRMPRVKNLMVEMSKISIWGAGGHGKVVLDAAIKSAMPIEGIIDDFFEKKALYDVPIYRSNSIQLFNKTIIAIGNNSMRKEKYQLCRAQNIEFINVLHPSSILGLFVRLEQGIMILARAVVNSNSVIGANVIINTGAIVEHDVEICAHAHVAPGAVICGGCFVGENVMVGAGAIIQPNISICSNVTIGSGSIVTKNIKEAGVYYGSPVKKYDFK